VCLPLISRVDIFLIIQGVMITHGNIVATTAAVMTVIPNLGSKDVYLAYLPLAHVFEMAAEVISS